jgi:hypothetical protein
MSKEKNAETEVKAEATKTIEDIFNRAQTISDLSEKFIGRSPKDLGLSISAEMSKKLVDIENREVCIVGYQEKQGKFRPYLRMFVVPLSELPPCIVVCSGEVACRKIKEQVEKLPIRGTFKKMKGKANSYWDFL